MGSLGNIIKLSNFYTQPIAIAPNPSKLWNIYVEDISYQMIKKTRFSQPKSFLSFSHLYVRFSSENILKLIMKKDSCYSKQAASLTNTVMGKLCDAYLQNDSYTTVRQLIYPIAESHQRLCHQFLHFMQVKIIHFTFNLHPGFMLNVTILKMNIELSYRCTDEFAGIISVPVHYVNRICGKFPAMTYFLEYRAYIMMNLLADRKPGRIEIEFQIFDPDHIKQECCEGCRLLVSESKCYHTGARSNYKEVGQEESHQISFMFGISVLSMDTVTHVYLIQVHRVFRFDMRLHKHNGRAKAYDGPYTARKLLTVHDKRVHYTFSTFQATHAHIFKYTLNQTLHLKYNTTKYVSKCVCQAMLSQKYHFSSKEGIIHQTNCRGDCDCRRDKTTHCVIDIETNKEHYVNLTFIRIQYQGPNIDSCR